VRNLVRAGADPVVTMNLSGHGRGIFERRQRLTGRRLELFEKAMPGQSVQVDAEVIPAPRRTQQP
jgi:hypothetical protein